MRRFIKLLTLTTIVLLTLGTAGFIWTKYFVSTNWKNYYSDAEIADFANQINESQSLPTNIYEAYELVNPNQLNQGISGMENSVIWSLITGDDEQLANERTCYCITAAELFESCFPTKYHGFSWLFLGHALEPRTTEQKCFDYIYSEYLERLSNEHLNHPLDELTFNEAVEVVILSENPTRYSKHPEQLFKRITDLLSE